MIVTDTSIVGLEDRKSAGKVRDVYDLEDSLLIVATDRISAFDKVLPTGIPRKGEVLTQLSGYWFVVTKPTFENHVLYLDDDRIISHLQSHGVTNANEYRDTLKGRSMIVKKAKPYQLECVVRGYMTGGLWDEYRKVRDANPEAKTVTVWGHELPADMVESQELPEPIYTPSTKEKGGKHDITISVAQSLQIVGEEVGLMLEQKALALYKKASKSARNKGIIIADTKFEIGEFEGRPILIDEVLTPDSSRFWDAGIWTPGKSQPSYDKQFVRDYLKSICWSGDGPIPELPAHIVEQTTAKYLEAYRRIADVDL